MSGANTLDVTVMEPVKQGIGEEIWNLWTTWKGYSSEARTRWTENKRYTFATDTRDTENVSNPWSNTTIRPKLANIHDNLMVNYENALFPSDDWLHLDGEDREAVSKHKRTVVQSYLKTKHNTGSFYGVMEQLLQDWVIYGNCFASVNYLNDYALDPFTKEQVISYTGPEVKRISPYDIVFNPRATDFQHSPKIIRSLKTMGELTRDAEEVPELKYSKEVLAQVEQYRTDLNTYEAEDINRTTSFQADGFSSPSSYYRSGYVEIREFFGDIYDKDTQKWYKNHVVTVIDGGHVIRMEPMDTWTGRPHIYHCGWRNLPDNLWSQGPLDNLVGMQYRINHLQNSKDDAFDQMIDPDRVFKGDVEIEEVGAAKHYYVSESGDVGTLAPDTTILNADAQVRELEEMMEIYAGAPREALGIRTPGEKTAFEVSSLQSAAAKTFEAKTAKFSKFLEQVVNAEIEVARRNLDANDIIKIVDDDYGVEQFLTITKSDITAAGTLRAVGARHSKRQAQLVQNLSAFQQVAMADPMMLEHFSSIEMAKMYADLLGYDSKGLFKPYARIPERAEGERLAAVANDQVSEEQMIPTVAGEEGIPQEAVDQEGAVGPQGSPQG